MDMEIDIQSKTDNPLLKRTEIHFVIHHQGEGSPKRELIRSELAEKLNVKKENVMINAMQSSFGKAETIGYAKIYKSVNQAKEGEHDHILKRNNIQIKEKKKEAEPATSKEEEKEAPEKQEPAPKEEPAEQTPPEKVEEKQEAAQESKEEPQEDSQPAEPEKEQPPKEKEEQLQDTTTEEKKEEA